jgi:predicted amidophosphoribosyltransferase
MKREGFSLHVKLAGYSDAAADRVMHYVVLYLKRRSSIPLFERLAKELRQGVMEAIQSLGYDTDHALIVPLPRTPKSLRLYGTDAAVKLSKALSNETGIPCEPLLYRTRDSIEQKALGEAERLENLQGAFASRQVPPNVCVLLVDDVVTTGGSMYHAGKALKAAGARDMIAVSLATTQKKRKPA